MQHAVTVRRLAAAVIVVSALGAWCLTASWLTAGVDRNLEAHALALSATGDVDGLQSAHPALRAELSDRDEQASGARTVAGERVLTVAGEEGTVTLSQDLSESRLLLVGYSVLIALVAGLSVVLLAGTDRTSARWLRQSMERVASTGELQPVPETPNGELARSFNGMLTSLRETRLSQERRVEEFSHDLRNPLTALRINAELLLSLNEDGQERRLPPEEYRALERDVRAQLDEFAELIDELAGQSGEGDGPVRFDAVVEAACERVGRRRGDVAVQASTTPWLVHGDRGALGRCVSNLVDNAIKWSPSGGRVRVRLARDGDRRAVLTVADSGPGVEYGERDRVFDRFYRSPEVRDTPGTGLGLAIVKQVVDGIGGHIGVGESREGGALFTVMVPGSSG